MGFDERLLIYNYMSNDTIRIKLDPLTASTLEEIRRDLFDGDTTVPFHRVISRLSEGYVHTRRDFYTDREPYVYRGGK